MMNQLFNKWYFPISLKYFSLIIYMGLLVIGLTASSADADFLNQLRNTNAGNLIIWSYWWPFIVIAAIFFGRVWCMVCPVEVITSLFAKIGLKRKRPRWLRSGWGITLFYILILFVGIQGLAIHRNPTYMAVYLATIAGVSVFSGLIFEKNTFCRYICPVGHLLGIYSRLSFMGWRVKDKTICQNCSDKSCISKKYLYNQNYKSCGVDLYPEKIDDNTNCILCGGCMKTCAKYQSKPIAERPNPRFKRIGFASDLMKLNPLKMAEMIFVLVVSGFVIYEILAEWDMTKNMLMFFPNLVAESLSIKSAVLFGITKSTILFAILPFIIWYIPFGLARLNGNKIKISNYFLQYGIAFIPVMAAAHLSKAVLKTVSRLPYFEHLPTDLTGMTTAQKIVDGQIVLQQNPQWAQILLSVVVTIVMLSGIGLSIKIIKKLNLKQQQKYNAAWFYLIPAIYGGVFLVMLIAWRWM